MSEPRDNSNDRLEAGLRQWGAQQAADQAGPKAAPDWVGQAARAPSPAGPPSAADKAARVGGAAIRWLALAAAIVLMIGASVYITAWVVGSKAPATASPPLAGLQVDAAALQRQLAKAQEDVARLSASLVEAREKLAAAEGDKAIVEKFPQLQRELAENGAARITAEAKALELKLQLTGKDATIKATQDELANLKGRFDELQKLHQQSENQLTVTRKRLAAAAEELTATDRARERTAEELRKAQAQIAQLQAQQSAMAMDFQQLMSGLGETTSVEGVSPAREAGTHTGGAAATPARGPSLAARQDAMRRARMLGRLSEIRPQVTHEDTLRLLDRLEVVLTRLDLLNAADASAARQFAMLVRHGAFATAIDEVLAVPQTPQARSWLLQAKLLLTEVDNVG